MASPPRPQTSTADAGGRGGLDRVRGSSLHRRKDAAVTDENPTPADVAEELVKSRDTEPVETNDPTFASSLAGSIAVLGGEAHIKRTPTGLYKVRFAGEGKESDW